MFPRTILLTSLLAASVAYGSPAKARSIYTVKDSHSVPKKWTRVGTAPGDHVISLKIGLKQSNFEKLEEQLYEGESCYELYWEHSDLPFDSL